MSKFQRFAPRIAGVPLIDAGRKAVDMLRRNMLNTIGVWWLPPMIVQVGPSKYSRHTPSEVSNHLQWLSGAKACWKYRHVGH